MALARLELPEGYVVGLDGRAFRGPEASARCRCHKWHGLPAHDSREDARASANVIDGSIAEKTKVKTLKVCAVSTLQVSSVADRCANNRWRVDEKAVRRKRKVLFSRTTACSSERRPSVFPYQKKAG